MATIKKTKTKTKNRKRGASREEILARFDHLQEEIESFGRDVDRLLDDAVSSDVRCGGTLASLGLTEGRY